MLKEDSSVQIASIVKRGGYVRKRDGTGDEKSDVTSPSPVKRASSAPRIQAQASSSAAKPAAAAAAAAATTTTKKPAAPAAAAAKKPVAATKPGASGAKSSATSSSKAPAAKKTTAKPKTTTTAKKASPAKKEMSEEERLKAEEELERQREEREAAERERREREQRMRDELTALILEEEKRIQKKEEDKKKREREYNRRKTKIFEHAFDDELEDVRQLLGISDASGKIQRACTTDPDSMTCVCLCDPWYRGINSLTSYVEPDCVNENNSTPLSEAAVGGATSVLRELLRHGATSVIDLQDSHGRTPIFRAAFMRKPEACRLLLSYGANCDIRNNDGESPMDAASDQEVKEVRCLHALREENEEEKEEDEEDKLAQISDVCCKILAGFSAERMEEARARIEQELHACWTPPPQEKEPADLVPQTAHSCRIGLRALQETLDEIRKADRRPALIIDLSSNAQTFLRYRDNNLLMTYKPGDLEPETVRKALIGALRYGKPFVIDNGDLVLDWVKLEQTFDKISPTLWMDIVMCSITKDHKFFHLVKKEDGELFLEHQFTQHCLDHFQFILLSRLPQVPQAFSDTFYLVTTA
ncbi:hypothetical protein GUITHDRAFT_111938 [Guillardia theta CCMP2712]|uniref:Uncharacterized protein n=2 Tax=Guillardia theta TaxID=55529 RepID=L1J1W4_GUITC|nr:hypothetical protein GUITHDRAFT_111938 [Guillardia theta CCMP2712]EKX42085.1 hypothetical protein GUITHDRAFT_111938 [Guillardia theta CCMP2712]|eukprot:XP_005829065.1 hypothetical protein GUITHDRAFT_111938 [Guillardia theta CCMP2712]